MIMKVPLASRETFMSRLNDALSSQSGFAAGKLGYSEQVWITSAWASNQGPSSHLDSAIRAAARFHACYQLGAYPTDDTYLKTALEKFVESVSAMDFIAAHESPLVQEIQKNLNLEGRVMPFDSLEPNREIPYNPQKCYLPSLRGKRVLIITSPAELLRERANKVTFEATWAATGCPWFEPKSVEALGFDSLFDENTRNHFPSSESLITEITSQLGPLEFDVALVAASCMAIPICAAIKRSGRIGISLGGHLQVLFGVQGKRWRDNATWQGNYWNESWIDMPPYLHPKSTNWLVDDGAYW